jgi:hypothetical protein
MAAGLNFRDISSFISCSVCAICVLTTKEAGLKKMSHFCCCDFADRNLHGGEFGLLSEIRPEDGNECK